MGLKNIIKGHLNEVLNKNQDLRDLRMEICKQCPLYFENKYGLLLCNPNLFLNPNDNTTRKEKAVGYYRGCGCRLEAKTRDDKSECPAKKWGKK